MGFKEVDGGLEHLQPDLFGRKLGNQLRLLFKENSLRLEGEIVEGKVGDGQRTNTPEGVFPDRECLLGQLEHQVDADVGNATVVDGVDGLGGAGGVMGPSKKDEVAIVKGLDAKTDAVNAEEMELLHERGGDILGIGLEGDLAIGSDLGGGADRSEQCGVMVGSKLGGCATAEIDGDDLFALKLGQAKSPFFE